MILPLRVPVVMMGTTIGAAGVIALFAALVGADLPVGEGLGLPITILVAGFIIAVAVGAAGLFLEHSLRRRLHAIAEIADTAYPQSRQDDPLAEIAARFRRLSEAIGQRDAALGASALELRDARKQLREVATYLETAREGERKRIARDIHDDLGQALSTLKLDLSLLQDELGDQPALIRGRIGGMTNLVSTSIKSVKRIISELRPQVLDDLGLTPAIEWQAEEFQKRTGIPVDLSIYPQEIILEPDQSTALFRIFQETLANVARHAGARSVRASLTEIDGVVELEVQDDGRGISPGQAQDPRSFGLLGIRERAHAWGGTVEIEGSAERGTRVRIRFELQEGS